MIFEKICEMIAEQFSIDASAITMKTAYTEDLGADSLDLVELSMAIEEEFDLGEIGDEELAGLKTVGDTVRFIKSRIGED